LVVEVVFLRTLEALIVKLNPCLCVDDGLRLDEGLYFGVVVGFLVDDDLLVVLGLTAELGFRVEVDLKVDVCRVVRLDFFVVELDREVDICLETELGLVVERLVGFEVECEVMTLVRLAAREDFIDDFEIDVDLEPPVMLLWLRDVVCDDVDDFDAALLLLV
jgi:hypothetical protein